MKKHAEHSGVRVDARCAVAVVASLVVLVGCQAGDGEGRDGMHVTQPGPSDEEEVLATIDDLMSLPSAEDMLSPYRDIGADVRSAVDDDLGALQWDTEEAGLRTGSVCNGPYERLEGRSVAVRSTVDGPPLEGESWDRAEDAVRRAAETHGFTVETLVIDEEGAHEVEFAGDRGAFVRVYSHSSFGLTIQSGCYLTNSDRDAIELYGVPDPERWARKYPNSSLVPSDPGRPLGAHG
jgi:Lipoprotein confined to pathogenic Mycobacterium